MRKLTVLLTLIALSVLSIATGGANNDTSLPTRSLQVAKQQSTLTDPPGTIDGAVNPELIPDAAAYSVMFRMLSNWHTESAARSIRAYIRRIVGLGIQKPCQGCRSSVGAGDTDIDALLSTAKEFHQRVSVLDDKVKGIKDRTWPNPNAETMAQLTALQRQKEQIIADLSVSLSTRLSVGGLQRVHQHVNGHVKRNIKLSLSQDASPGGNTRQHLDHQ